jgi:hypothetical protein
MQKDLVFSEIMMIQILMSNGNIPTFVWGPQEAFLHHLIGVVFHQYKVILKVSD